MAQNRISLLNEKHITYHCLSNGRGFEKSSEFALFSHFDCFGRMPMTLGNFWRWETFGARETFGEIEKFWMGLETV